MFVSPQTGLFKLLHFPVIVLKAEELSHDGIALSQRGSPILQGKKLL